MVFVFSAPLTSTTMLEAKKPSACWQNTAPKGSSSRVPVRVNRTITLYQSGLFYSSVSAGLIFAGLFCSRGKDQPITHVQIRLENEVFSLVGQEFSTLTDLIQVVFILEW